MPPQELPQELPRTDPDSSIGTSPGATPKNISRSIPRHRPRNPQGSAQAHSQESPQRITPSIYTNTNFSAAPQEHIEAAPKSLLQNSYRVCPAVSCATARDGLNLRRLSQTGRAATEPAKQIYKRVAGAGVCSTHPTQSHFWFGIQAGGGAHRPSARTYWVSKIYCFLLDAIGICDLARDTCSKSLKHFQQCVSSQVQAGRSGSDRPTH